jgi:hypothetical protein
MRKLGVIWICAACIAGAQLGLDLWSIVQNPKYGPSTYSKAFWVGELTILALYFAGIVVGTGLIAKKKWGLRGAAGLASVLLLYSTAYVLSGEYIHSGLAYLLAGFGGIALAVSTIIVAVKNRSKPNPIDRV